MKPFTQLAKLHHWIEIWFFHGAHGSFDARVNFWFKSSSFSGDIDFIDIGNTHTYLLSGVGGSAKSTHGNLMTDQAVLFYLLYTGGLYSDRLVHEAI